MSTTAIEWDTVVTAATAGDERAFTLLVSRHRREIQSHAYRILGSHEDSEDVAQETFLRAWDKRASFRGRSTFRAWLYAIATNASLDARGRQQRHRHTPDADGVLEAIAAPDASPEDAIVSSETVELTLIAARRLPPRQRAILILRDVLGWSARDAAQLLETSVAAGNSALQRARTALNEHRTEPRLEWRRDG
ncbi:MAG: sigma-70 family RNA polymerase sigma factor [Burkholderiales bacterium]